MKRMTFQCASVSSSMPSRRARSGAISSVHCSGWTKKPSSLSSTTEVAMVNVDTSDLLVGWAGDPRLAGRGHRRADPRDVTAGQEAVPVEPLEHQLAEVVERGLLEQRETGGDREVAGKRLCVVVEVDEQGFVEAGLDEAVGVPVEAGLERLVGEEVADVVDHRFAFEMRDRSGFGRGHVGGITDHEHVRSGFGLKR